MGIGSAFLLMLIRNSINRKQPKVIENDKETKEIVLKQIQEGRQIDKDGKESMRKSRYLEEEEISSKKSSQHLSQRKNIERVEKIEKGQQKPSSQIIPIEKNSLDQQTHLKQSNQLQNILLQKKDENSQNSHKIIEQKESKQLERKLQQKQNEYNNLLIQFDRINEVNKQLESLIKNYHNQEENKKISFKQMQIKVKQLQNRVRQLEEEQLQPNAGKLLQKPKQSNILEDSNQNKQTIQSKAKKLEKVSQEKNNQSGTVASEQITLIKRNITVRNLLNQKKLNEHESAQIIKKLIKKITGDIQNKIFIVYIPQMIFLIGYHPQLIGEVEIEISAISQKNKEIQKQYFSPEIARGENPTQKSSLFNLGIIWDQLLHGELYFKNIDELLSSSYDYRVRNNRMNPIYKNTLYQMLNKNTKQRMGLDGLTRIFSV